MEEEDGGKKEYEPGFRFDLHEITDEYSKFLFRFTKEEIVRLREALLIPNEITVEDRSTFNGTEGQCFTSF